MYRYRFGLKPKPTEIFKPIPKPKPKENSNRYRYLTSVSGIGIGYTEIIDVRSIQTTNLAPKPSIVELGYGEPRSESCLCLFWLG